MQKWTMPRRVIPLTALSLMFLGAGMASASNVQLFASLPDGAGYEGRAS